jgi:hypothetical protein
MGNDMSVFEEGELEKDFWKAYGPKNESENVIVFVLAMLQVLCDGSRCDLSWFCCFLSQAGRSSLRALSLDSRRF